MKVAYIDHSLVVPVNRARITEFNRSTPHEMVGVAPRVWRDPQMGAAYRNASTPEVMFLHKIGPSHPVKHAYHPVQLIHALRSTRVMLVHANLEAYSLGARQLAWTCALLDLPLVLSVWQNQAHRRHEHLSRPVIQRCALMTGYTRQIAETWQSLVPVMPVLPWGLDVTLFRPYGSDKRPSAGGRVGYLGRLVSAKGVDLLLKAAAMGGTWRLVLNDLPGREEAQALAERLGVMDRVDFVPLTYETVPAHLASLDVLVLPSRATSRGKEQFGRVLIEAMAMGTPVIGSTCGAIPEVIGTAGLIFPDGDASALAAAITQLLSDHTTWQTLRERGHRRSLSYSWEHIAQESARLYEQVIEETATRRRRG